MPAWIVLLQERILQCCTFEIHGEIRTNKDFGSWADAQASQIQHTFPYGNPDYFTFRVPLQTALIMDK